MGIRTKQAVVPNVVPRFLTPCKIKVVTCCSLVTGGEHPAGERSMNEIGQVLVARGSSYNDFSVNSLTFSCGMP